MKILHISTAKSWRGGESQLCYLASAIDKQHGYEQCVACLDDSKVEQYCNVNGIASYSLRARTGLGLQLIYDLMKVIHQYQPTVIHAHDAHAHTYGLIAQVLSRNKIPMVVSRRVCFKLKDNIFSQWKYNHRLTAKLLCVSKAIYHTIKSQNVVDSNKLMVVYDGVDTNINYDKKAAMSIRQQYHLADSDFLVANYSALTKNKDCVTFIKVAQQIAATREDVKFIILGSGDQFEFLQAMIKQYQLTQVVFLAGFVKNARQLLPAFDCVMMTSRSEGLGSSLLDAMAANVPVIATRVGGIPEIVIDGETGLSAPAADVEALSAALQRLLNDKPLNLYIRTQAKSFVKQFSLEKLASYTLSAYRAALQH